MKRKLYIVGIFACAAASFFWLSNARAQQATTTTTTSDPAAQVPAKTQPLFSLAVDRRTWELYDPINPSSDLSAYNTQQMKWARYEAVLAFERPQEYLQLHPLSADEIARRDKLAQEFMRPGNQSATQPTQGQMDLIAREVKLNHDTPYRVVTVN